MHAVYGLALLSAGTLLIVYLARSKNLASAPKWTSYRSLVQTLFFASFAAVVFGVALIGQFILDFRSESFGVLEIALLAIIGAATALLWHRLKRLRPL